MGAIVHPTGGLNTRSLAEFPAAHRLRLPPLDKWVFRGGFGINTIDIRFPNALQQFDEYQAQVVQQRAPGDPRPLFQLSQGPSPVVLQCAVRQLGTLCGHQLRLAQPILDGREPASRLRGNWNATVEYQVSANNLVKIMYQGSAGIHLVESWNINAFPD